MDKTFASFSEWELGGWLHRSYQERKDARPKQETPQMTPQLDQALREARARLSALYGDRLRHVILYGSQARGDAGPESDVDILVVLEGPFNLYPEIKRLVDVEIALFERYGFHFSFKPYDEETYGAAWHPLMMNVRAEGVEL